MTTTSQFKFCTISPDGEAASGTEAWSDERATLLITESYKKGWHIADFHAEYGELTLRQKSDGRLITLSATEPPKLSDTLYQEVWAVLRETEPLMWDYTSSNVIMLRQGPRTTTHQRTMAMIQAGLLTELSGKDTPARLTLRALMAYCARKARKNAPGYAADLIPLYLCAGMATSRHPLHTVAEYVTQGHHFDTYYALRFRAARATTLEALAAVLQADPSGDPNARLVETVLARAHELGQESVQASH